MNPDLPPNPREELEAKVTALLLGELSAEEASSVREMIAKDADLARLQARLSLTLDLLRETAATPVGETPAQPAPLRLSPERREKLLAHFKTIKPKEFEKAKRRERSWLIPLAAAAALALMYAAMPKMAGRFEAPWYARFTAQDFVKARTTSYQNAVVNNLRLLDSAKQQWALEQRKSETDVPTMEDLRPYVGRGANNELPGGPGETYILGAVGQPPVVQVDGGWGNKKIITLPGDEGNLAALNQPARSLAMSERLGGKVVESAPTATQATPAANQIFLPQAGEEQLAEANNQLVTRSQAATLQNENSAQNSLLQNNNQQFAQANTANNFVNDGSVQSSQLYDNSIGGAAGGGRLAFQTAQKENRKEAEPPRPAPVVGAAPAPAGISGAVASAIESDSATPHVLTESFAIADEEAVRRAAPTPQSAPSMNWRASRSAGRESAAAASPAPATKSVRSFGGLAGTSAASVDSFNLDSTKKDKSAAEKKPAPSFLGTPREGAAVDAVTSSGFTMATSAPPNKFVGRYAYVLPSGLTQPAPAASAPLNQSIGLQGGTAPPAAPPVETAKNSKGELASSENTWISSAQPVPTAGKRLDQTDAPLPHPALPAPVPQAEVQTRDNPFTTFSLNVSDVAFKLAAASLQNGVMPEAASMRSEEFINAFDYRDPEPAPGAPIGFAWERAGYPFAHNRDLLRFSIKTAAQGRQAGRPLNLVLLLDKSGSMERADRVEIISQALRVLASQLQPQDTLSVVVFARTARLWVDGVPGSQAGDVARDLRGLTPEGGTNLEEAMKLAYATALRHYLANGENRVVLLTDGAANLGSVDPDALKQKVESNHKQGIALDCFGVGWDGYNDTLLETLSRAGNGRYGFINTPEEAATEFAGKLAGALRVAAADVKVQVEFNSNRVTSYRQIGYAKDQLKKEQFRDNSVSAAQLTAAESGNALYTVEINPSGDGPLGTVHVRFRVPGTSDYQEHDWTVPYTGSAVSLDKASPAMRLAASAAAFSEWLAASPYAGEVIPDRLLVYVSGLPQTYGADARPAKLEWMIRQAKSISGK